MGGSGALVQWHDPGLNRMNVAAKTAGNYKTLCWLSRLGWLRRARSSDAGRQLAATYREFMWKRADCHIRSVLRVRRSALCQPSQGHQINSSEVNHVTSSRLRMPLGLAQLAFGLLLLGEHFWSPSAEADWSSEWKKIVATAIKKGKSFFKGRVRRHVCYLL